MTRGHTSRSLLLRHVLIAFGTAVLGLAQPFDIVLRHGRVMDPESGLDAVRNIGIQGKSIAAITMEPIRGKQEIDARGLVVTAGFIDLHCHGQTPEAYALRARDGVTSALELEIGVDPIRSWYTAREGKSLIHHGASAGHIPARMIVMKARALASARPCGHRGRDPGGAQEHRCPAGPSATRRRPGHRLRTQLHAQGIA